MSSTTTTTAQIVPASSPITVDDYNQSAPFTIQSSANNTTILTGFIRQYQPTDLTDAKRLLRATQAEYGNPADYVDNAFLTDMSDIVANYLQPVNSNWWIIEATDTTNNTDTVNPTTKSSSVIIGQIAIHPLLLGDSGYYNELQQLFHTNTNNNPVDYLNPALEPLIRTIPLSQIGELRRMAIDKAYRKSGIGNKLLSHFLYWARTVAKYRAIHLTTLSTMIPACRFYEKNGFELSHLEIFSVEDGSRELQSANKQLIEAKSADSTNSNTANNNNNNNNTTAAFIEGIQHHCGHTAILNSPTVSIKRIPGPTVPANIDITVSPAVSGILYIAHYWYIFK